MRRRTFGFTLIELLVVIAIIAVLAGILFPVFAQARDKARQSTCASNTRQLGMAMMAYTQDYDERYPGRWTGWVDPPVTPRQAFVSWRGLLQPYVKDVGIYRCPSNTVSKGSSAADVYDRYMNPPVPAGYSCNGDNNMVGGRTPMSSNTGVLMSEIPFPAQTIFIVENSNWRVEICLRPTCNPPTTAQPELFAAHGQFVNCIFGDGHAKPMKPTATGTPRNLWSIDTNEQPAPAALQTMLRDIENYWARK